MKKSNLPYLLSVLLCAVFGMSRCTSPLQAGGGSGTDVSACVIYGIVVDTLDIPARGSLVRLRPFDYLTDEPGNDSAVKRDSYASDDGRFSLDSIPAGSYTIEIVSADSCAQVTSCVIDSGDSVFFLDVAIVRPMAGISGNDMGKPSAPSDNRTIRVRGMERSTPINSDGTFSLNVPAGWSRLHIPDTDPGNEAVDTLIYLNPGEQKQYSGTVPHLNFCTDLECDLAAVQEILDSNGIIVPADSFVDIRNERVVGLHLDKLGLTTLPPAVTQITDLEFLDVSENVLTSLPHNIEMLRHLKVLKANNNQLQSVPASLGMIRGLETLDLSFNQLQSLPEPITYLTPTFLKMGFNRLCNIGEETEKWLFKYDRGWYERQTCDWVE